MGSSWSWSYGSWIYSYLCNQCLSPLKLRVRTPFMARCTRYNISDLRQVGGFFRFPPSIKPGADPGGGAPPPPKIAKKIKKIGVKSWFFIRNTPEIFARPSARRNFFKCAPLTWNPGSAPENWPPRYSWNSIESGVKHHKPNQYHMEIF